MSTGRILLALLAFGAIPNAALAEETLRADTPRLDTRPVPKRTPLAGGVSVQAHHKLPAPVVARKPAPVAQPKTVVSVAPQRSPLSASANSFEGVPMQGSVDRNPYMRGFTGFNPWAMRAQQMQQQVQKPKWTNPDDAPYRWGQCGTGGYYDTTGTYKGAMVWGDKLASYGGRFFDGTPVPKGEVKINAMGHIWWQNQLSTNFVKLEELRKKGLPY